jgi:uncharacterized membrane protein
MSVALWLVLSVSVGLVLAGAALAQDTEMLDGRAAVPPSVDGLTQALHWMGRAIEVVGIGIIVLGALISSLYFLWQLLNSRAALTEIYHAYRANLGRGLLLGLEFLIAADIIGTVAVAPTLENLGVLAIIVLIRTFLSFALEVEIQGHWPWQHSRITGEVAEKLPDQPGV